MERTLTYAEAIHEATEQEMARDPSVIVMGLGVYDPKGIYGTTLGLVEKFGPDRVFDTPLSEDGMTGVAIGMSLAGKVTQHTGDSGEPVTSPAQMPGQFVVARTASLVAGHKCLVNEQNMHRRPLIIQ